MERFGILLRVSVTLLLLGTMTELAHSVGERVALQTAPQTVQTTNLVVQARRTIMDRIAQGRLLLQSDPTHAEAILVQVFRDARDPELRARASELLTQVAADSWPEDHRGTFLSRLAPAALESGRTNQIPPSIVLAQAALESGWGRSRLARRHHNLFGVKATGKQASAEYNTLEFGAKGAHIIKARFRTFDSQQESVHHHGRLLANDHRYASARVLNDNWRAFLSEMASTYASDPAYAAHIAQIIETYRLDRWDGVAQPIMRKTNS